MAGIKCWRVVLMLSCHCILTYRIQMLRQLEKYRLILSPFFHWFLLLHLPHKGMSGSWIYQLFPYLLIYRTFYNWEITLPYLWTIDLTVDLIKWIESNIYKLPINERISISNHSFSVLNSLASCSLHCTEVNRSLSQLAKHTRVFLRDMNDRIIFICADKGNVTIASNRCTFPG